MTLYADLSKDSRTLEEELVKRGFEFQRVHCAREGSLPTLETQLVTIVGLGNIRQFLLGALDSSAPDSK